MTPALRGPRAMGMYFSDAKLEDKVEFRKQVIACKPEDIVALADVVEPVLNDNHICTMGNEQKIKDAGNVFDNIVSFRLNNFISINDIALIFSLTYL